MNTREARNLIEKLENLPAQRQAEVEDFVDFLRSREDNHRPGCHELLPGTINAPVRAQDAHATQPRQRSPGRFKGFRKD